MMALPVQDCLRAIETHTRGLAATAQQDLGARIEHCPQWSMADLVWHLTEVHAFWNDIATTLPSDQPEDRPALQRPADEELVAGLLTGMATLVDTLREADQTAACWTWGQQQDIGFITRHQVQEAAVHHWDALNAIGRAQDWRMDDLAAIDAVEEFLTHSVANPRWPMPDADPLGGMLTIAVARPEGGATLYVTDGPSAGTVGHSVAPGDGTGADPGDVLLWLYRRVPDLAAQPDRALLERFRALTFTD